VVIWPEVVTIDIEVAAHTAHSTDEGLEWAEASEGTVDETAGISAHDAVEVPERDHSDGRDVES
jgi:hypothetical protein